jgi:hypothetical protein
MFILSTIILIIVNLIEAKLQSIILKEFTEYVPENKEMQNKYHFWFSVYYAAFVVALILVGHMSLLIIPIAMFSRKLFFQEGLNYFRKLPFGYLSDRGIDKITKNIFGEEGGKLVAALCIFIIALCVFLQN